MNSFIYLIFLYLYIKDNVRINKTTPTPWAYYNKQNKFRQMKSTGFQFIYFYTSWLLLYLFQVSIFRFLYDFHSIKLRERLGP